MAAGMAWKATVAGEHLVETLESESEEEEEEEEGEEDDADQWIKMTRKTMMMMMIQMTNDEPLSCLVWVSVTQEAMTMKMKMKMKMKTKGTDDDNRQCICVSNQYKQTDMDQAVNMECEPHPIHHVYLFGTLQGNNSPCEPER
jgi:hypothetical protein